jgi:hypothetical protein
VVSYGPQVMEIWVWTKIKSCRMPDVGVMPITSVLGRLAEGS